MFSLCFNMHFNLTNSQFGVKCVKLLRESSRCSWYFIIYCSSCSRSLLHLPNAPEPIVVSFHVHAWCLPRGEVSKGQLQSVAKCSCILQLPVASLLLLGLLRHVRLLVQTIQRKSGDAQQCVGSRYKLRRLRRWFVCDEMFNKAAFDFIHHQLHDHLLDVHFTLWSAWWRWQVRNDEQLRSHSELVKFISFQIWR